VIHKLYGIKKWLWKEHLRQWDNLPNLHYKNLAAGFEKHITPTLLNAYLGFLFLNTKIYRSKQSQKSYMELLTLTALLIVTGKKDT